MHGGAPSIRLVAAAAVWTLPLLFVVVPIGAFLLLSVFSVENNTIVRRLTLINYSEFFGNPTYWRTYLGTLWLGAS